MSQSGRLQWRPLHAVCNGHLHEEEITRSSRSSSTTTTTTAIENPEKVSQGVVSTVCSRWSPECCRGGSPSWASFPLSQGREKVSRKDRNGVRRVLSGNLPTCLCLSTRRIGPKRNKMSFKSKVNWILPGPGVPPSVAQAAPIPWAHPCWRTRSPTRSVPICPPAQRLISSPAKPSLVVVVHRRGERCLYIDPHGCPCLSPMSLLLSLLPHHPPTLAQPHHILTVIVNFIRST